MSNQIKAIGSARKTVALALLPSLLWLAGPKEAEAHPQVWTTTGPEGGRFTSLAIDPVKTRILYVGTRGGGIFKSTDGGEQWRAASAGLRRRHITSLAVNPKTPTTLYAGTLDALVLKSTDGGDTWKEINTGPTEFHRFGIESAWSDNLVTLAIDPQNPDTLYAGISSPYAWGLIFKSTDGGGTWDLASGWPDFPFERLLDLKIDSQTLATLYAVVHCDCGDVLKSGVFKSTDGGATWAYASAGLPTVDPWATNRPAPVLNVGIDPLNPATLYAGTYRRGVFKSTDGGGSWRPASAGLPSNQGGYLTGYVAIDPVRPTTLYTDTAHGPFTSTDGGESWFPTSHDGSVNPVGNIVIDPSYPQTLYVVANLNTISKSTNSGRTWSDASKGIINTYISTLAVHPLNPGTVYAGLCGMDCTASFIEHLAFKSTDRGSRWSPANRGLPTWTLSTLSRFVIDPHTPATLITGAGRSLFKTTDGGDTWTQLDWTLRPGLKAPIGPIAVDPWTPNTLYAAGSGLFFRSTDGGSSWTMLNDGLHDPPPFWSSDIEFGSPTTLYVLGTNGLERGVFKSTDGGATWRASNGGLPQKPGSLSLIDVKELVVSPRNRTTLYLVTFEEGVFRSDDGAASWRAINTGLDSRLSRLIWALAVHPRQPDTLYAGTQGGIYHSTDGGDTWHPFNAGLNGLIITALAIDPDPPGAIYAGTHGGGVFALSPAPVPVEVVGSDSR